MLLVAVLLGAVALALLLDVVHAQALARVLLAPVLLAEKLAADWRWLEYTLI